MSKDTGSKLKLFVIANKPFSSSLCPRQCADCRLRSAGGVQSVSAQELAFIQSFRTSTMDVAAGASIISEQHPESKLFTLYAGWAFRYKTMSDGRRQILNFLLPGDFIGLQQEFSDGPMHGVEAITPVSLCVFPREGLWELFRQHPGLGYGLTWLTAREEGYVDDSLLTAGRRNATERVAMLLMHLYRRLERIGAELEDAKGLTRSVEFPINQQHIADNLGLSLVHTNKTMRRLQKMGLHKVTDGRLRLLNTKALERIADYYDKPPRKVPLL